MAKVEGESLPWQIERYKLAILGAASVGKSALVACYKKGDFQRGEEQTFMASFSNLSVDPSLSLDVWEVAGEERWQNLAHLYYKDAQGVLVVYSVQDVQSYDIAILWIRELREKLGTKPVIAIAANKMDLWNDSCMDPVELRKQARDNGYIFIETSAKTGQNVKELFTVIANELRSSRVELKEDEESFCKLQ